MSNVASGNIRFSVSEYLRMSNAGIFGSRRTELLLGRIVKMARQLNPHRCAVSMISRFLVHVTTPNDWLVVRGTFFVNEYSAPEPDFHLFDVPEGTPDEKLPLPILVIEVSDTTYKRDSTTKMRLYARAGIEDYWIVNLRDRRVEVFRQPKKPDAKTPRWHYASVTHLLPGHVASSLKRPKMKFAVEAMLP